MARLFDGVDDALTVARSASIEPAFPLALGCWVLSAAPDSFRYLVSKVDVVGDHPSYGMSTNGSGQIRFLVSTPLLFVASPTSAAPWDGGWHHVLGTYDGVTVRLYVDGAEVGTGTANTEAVSYNAAQPLVLGSFDNNILWYPGRLADVALWSAVPGAGERAALAAGVPASRIRTDALCGYWPLYGGSSPESDMSGRANNATVSGTTAVSHAPIGPYAPPITLYPLSTAAGGASVDATASLSVTASRTAAAATAQPAGATTAVTATLSGSATVTRDGGVALGATATITATATVARVATATLAVTATLSGTAGQPTTPGRLTGTTSRTGGPT